MENSNKKTEKEVLSMVHDLIKAGHAEELQDAILDAFSNSFKDQRDARIKKLKDVLQDIVGVIEGNVLYTTDEDDVTYLINPQKEDSIKLEIIGGMIF